MGKYGTEGGRRIKGYSKLIPTKWTDGESRRIAKKHTNLVRRREGKADIMEQMMSKNESDISAEKLAEAIMAGMERGTDGFNEVMGWDTTSPEPCGHHCPSDCPQCGDYAYETRDLEDEFNEAILDWVSVDECEHGIDLNVKDCKSCLGEDNDYDEATDCESKRSLDEIVESLNILVTKRRTTETFAGGYFYGHDRISVEDFDDDYHIGFGATIYTMETGDCQSE